MCVVCDNKEEVMDLRGHGRSWWEGGFGNDVNTELTDKILFFSKKENGGVYPKWTFSPAIKRKEIMSSVRKWMKMDEYG